VFREIAGEGLPWEGFGAIADVDRRLRGRAAVGLLILRLDAEAAGAGARLAEEALSGLGVALPLLCVEGGLDDLGDEVLESLCDIDCDRCRSVNSEVFFLLS
jgi:hypothetical protein